MHYIGVTLRITVLNVVTMCKLLEEVTHNGSSP